MVPLPPLPTVTATAAAVSGAGLEEAGSYFSGTLAQATGSGVQKPTCLKETGSC